MEKSRLYQQFQNPEARFRSFPFWSWNARMEPEEVREQIRGMKKAGMGGFFMHSRNGLETPYMEEEWMECVKVAVETAADLGMYAWLYDEDRWPSGTAGGKVPALGEEFRCKGLTLEIREPEEYSALLQEGGLTALYAGIFQDMEISEFRRLFADEPEELLPGERILAVRLEVSGTSGWFNGQTPPDQLNPDCVRKFLELTHEKYREAVGAQFGKAVPGIFTDEPSLADTHTSFAPNRGWIPWTDGFGEYFRERRGYDFLDVLPWQYFNGKRSVKTRHDYWHTIAERFSEKYSETIHDWCRANGIAYTGHFLQEDKIGLCTRVNGAIMPHYALQDIPGIDILTESTKEYLTVKQCASVAHQFGKERVLTETYGCTGWDFTLEGQKWVGDWQYVLGVNLRTTHTAQYTLRGCRKRDYPPSFNYNNTCWEKNPVVEDYFARLGAVLTRGEPVRKLLLIHPAGTAWSRVGTNPYGNPIRREERDVPAVNEYGYRLNALLENLCREHMDCDLGDEMLMQRHGFSENGKIRIEKALYEAVVVPQMDTLFASTCELLLKCLEQGGKVIFLKPVPFMVEGDAENTEILRRVLEHPGCRVMPEEELVGVLESMGMRECRFLDDRGQEQRELLVMTRKTQEGMLLFTVNNNREKACEARVFLPWEGEVEEWDPLTGESRKVEEGIPLTGGSRNAPCEENGVEVPIIGTKTSAPGAGRHFTARWERAGSHLYMIRIKKQEECKGEETAPAHAIPLKENFFSDTEKERRRENACQGEKEQCREEFRDGKGPESAPDIDVEEKQKTAGEEKPERMEKSDFEWYNEKKYTAKREHILPEYAEISLNVPNVLTLDFCQYRMGKGEWSAPMEIWKAEKEIRRQLEMTETEVQRYLWMNEACEKDGTPVEMKFTFRAEKELAGCRLALEQPWRFRILCNGAEVPSKPEGWFLDKAFETVVLPALHRGENHLVLSCAYCNEMELENCYLLGEFGVDTERVLCEMPARLRPGDWTAQGLFHYCGTVAYEYQYHWDGKCAAALKLGEYAGVCAAVTVRERVYEIPWSLGETLDMTDALKEGDNILRIEIMGSPRNMLGPLHYRELHPKNTNAACFQPKEADYTERYQVVPYGLMERPVIVEESRG